LFYVQTNWNKNQEFLQTEKAFPAFKRHLSIEQIGILEMN
jgi:hypothetical protein